MKFLLIGIEERLKESDWMMSGRYREVMMKYRPMTDSCSSAAEHSLACFVEADVLFCGCN